MLLVARWMLPKGEVWNGEHGRRRPACKGLTLTKSNMRYNIPYICQAG